MLLGPAKKLESEVRKLEVIFLGQYRRQGKIAEGGFGVVWKGLDLKTNMEVAIKEQMKNDQESLRVWFQESQSHDVVCKDPSAPRVPKFIAQNYEPVVSPVVLPVLQFLFC